MTYDEAKLIFKKNIRSLEIGLHNYCNRTCTFCLLSVNSVKRREKSYKDSSSYTWKANKSTFCNQNIQFYKQCSL